MLDQCTSAFGLLLDMDWQCMFQCLFECVRVKVQCSDPTKIRTEKMFGIGGKTFKVQITMEVPVSGSKDGKSDGGHDDDDKTDDVSREGSMDTDTGKTTSNNPNSQKNSGGGSFSRGGTAGGSSTPPKLIISADGGEGFTLPPFQMPHRLWTLVLIVAQLCLVITLT